MSVAEEPVVVLFVEFVPVLVCVLIVMCCRAEYVLALASTTAYFSSLDNFLKGLKAYLSACQGAARLARCRPTLQTNMACMPDYGAR